MIQTRASRRQRGRGRVSATRASLRHIAKTEQAVAAYAPQLWGRVSPRLVRWVKGTLKEVKPQLETLVVESRAQSPEELYLQGLLEAYRFEDLPLEPLAPIVGALTTDVLQGYGWLPSDPRTPQIERVTRELIESDLFAFWRGRTDPALLARRIVRLRQAAGATTPNEGLSVEAMSSVLAAQYRGDFYSAERLIRGSYGAAANEVHMADLREQQYSHKVWVTSRDSRVRGGGGSQYNHRAMDGQSVPLDEPFVTPEGFRMMQPLDRSRGAPAGHIYNCRCVVIGVNR